MSGAVEIRNIPVFPTSLLPMLHEVMKKSMFMSERTSKSDYLSGPRPHKLGVVTGRLRSSVKGTAEIKGSNTIGHLGTNVVYAPAHELGYEPRNLPARPFLVPAIIDNLPKIQDMFVDVIMRELK